MRTKTEPYDEILIPVDIEVKNENSFKTFSTQVNFSNKLIQKIRHFLKLKLSRQERKGESKLSGTLSELEKTWNNVLQINKSRL